MTRANLEAFPRFELPAGFALRPYAPGDEATWVAVQGAADLHHDVTPALFRREFGDDAGRLRSRQRFLIAPDATVIGSATAWFGDDPLARPSGRVHWVAIAPAHQGRGLAKPLLAAVCARLSEFGHERAYLTTSSGRLPAIGLYLSFGFVPEVLGPDDRAAWGALRVRWPDLPLR